MFYSKKIILILLIVLFSITTVYPVSVSAQISSLYSYSYAGIKPFGGRIISIQPCKTPAGMMLTIGGPRGGQFLLTDSSRVFKHGVFRNGTWTLGNADTGTVTCKGKSGLFSPGFGTALIIAGTAISLYSTFGTNIIFQQAIGDTILKVSSAQIGQALGIAGFASKFGFGKKLDTLGHPHVIQMVGTSF
jgi:hypothetical protein